MSDNDTDDASDEKDFELALKSSSIDELLYAHDVILKEIHDRFGYREDWRAFVIDDRRDKWWKIVDGHEVMFQHGDVAYSARAIDDGQYCSDEIYTYRHLPKHVYRTKSHTMILVDTHTDGNIFLAVFDNALEQIDG